jgi:CelD/BcsL family acetyltransferase involved in cellulose biosynthesis
MNVLTRDISQDLTIHVIRHLDELLSLKSEWETLHVGDIQSGVFLSWDWLLQGFKARPDRFTVLVARSDDLSDRLVGILPLKSRVHWSRSKSQLQTQYEAGGRLIWSEYTGFICAPDWERPVLEAFANALAQMPWSTLSLRYIDQIERAELFRKAFPKADFSRSYKPYLINKGTTNNLLCPQVDLGESFDAFLVAALSANSRQKFRRAERKHLETGELHFTETDQSNFETNLDILMGFWRSKWEPIRGKAMTAKVAYSYQNMLRAALAADVLFMPVLWRGDRPLGVLAHVLDRKLSKVHFIMVGRDLEFDAPYVGQILHLASIEWSIAHGYRTYDFCHGDEPYKYSYGTSDRETKFLTLKRRSTKADLCFDDANIGDALIRIRGFLGAKQYDRAESACDQIIDAISATGVD